NFTSTPKFSIKGDQFIFKRDASLGTTGTALLQWSNGAGRFTFKSYALDNTLVGLDTSLAMQTLVFGFTLTPDTGSTITGTTRITVTKTTDKTGADVYVKSSGQ